MYTPVKANEEERCRGGVDLRTGKMQMRYTVCTEHPEQHKSELIPNHRSILQIEGHAGACLGDKPQG
jgi:hypothetical protein